MANVKNAELNLPGIDELFTSQKERDEANLKHIYEIPTDEIDPFPEHPYKVRDDEDMMNLVESVKASGILTPATVRKKDDGRYELLSGHRRKRACELAGLKTLRCEVVEMDRDQAVLFMVDSNLQRTTILPSEKAFAYKMKLEAMSRQGQRTDLTSTPVVSKFRTNEEVGKAGGESREQVRRYIRLTELTPELLTMVDEGRIALRPAVELSYLPKHQQDELRKCMEAEDCTPSHAQTIRFRKLSEEGKLTKEVMEVIMMEEKPNQKERLVIRGERVNKLFPPELPVAKREEYVVAALEYYSRYRERQKDRGAR